MTSDAKTTHADATEARPAEDLNPFQQSEFYVDPFPFYERLRHDAPILRTDLGWVAVDYDDCRQLLISDSTRQADPSEWQPDLGLPGIDELQQTVREWIGMSNPPDHLRRRAICDRAFSHRSVNALRDLIQAQVDTLIDAVEDRGEMDLVEDFAFPLPANVICELLGMPIEDRDRIRRWSDEVSRTYDPTVDKEALEAGIRSAIEVQEYFAELLAERRSNPRDDLLSAFVTFADVEGGLSSHEVASNALLVFLAGHETTAGVLGAGFLELLRERNRAQRDRLASDPTLIKGAVEEFMRFAGSVHAIWRVAVEDVPIRGQVIPAGSTIIPMLMAGSRDPSVYADPNVFDITRHHPRPHLGFGAGIHYCIGAPLAKLEIELAIETVLRRLPGITLVDENPAMTGGVVNRGPVHLPVTF